MTPLTVGTAIVGITEAIKRLIPSVNGYVTIIVAAVLGILAGFAGFGSLNWLSGLAVGLASAGTVTVATAVGGK